MTAPLSIRNRTMFVLSSSKTGLIALEGLAGRLAEGMMRGRVPLRRAYS